MSDRQARGNPSRLHAFDNVRGLAAVAVVALHSAYAYAHFPLPGLIWPVPLDEPSRVADAVFWAIEGSIMPLFFALSGYFLARSLATQSPQQVLAGRTRRLLLPMTTVGLAVLVIDLHVWVLGLITTDRATVREYRRLKFTPEIQEHLFGPGHLWYVEYLWILCAVVCGVAFFAARLKRSASDSEPESIPLRSGTTQFASSLAVLALLIMGLCGTLTWSPQVVLGFQHGWLPDPAKFFHAALCLFLGVTLYRSEDLISWTRRLAPGLLLVAAAAFVILLPTIHGAMENGQATQSNLMLGSLLAVFAVTATFGQIGAGLRWLNTPSDRLARLAQASFWIYLIHHPVLGLFQVAVRPLPLPAIVKGACVFLGTMAVCQWSYNRFASQGVLARLLSGDAPWTAARSPAAASTTIEEQRRKAA